MFDLHLCLSASVNVRPMSHTQTLGLYNKILVGNLFVHCYFSPSPPFLLISSILQMAITRNCNANVKNNVVNNAENNNAVSLPSILEQVLVMQDQML
jgi:hypothetical protein